MTLTDKQERVLSAIRDFETLKGHMPTLEELKEHLESSGFGTIRSLNSVAQYLKSLTKKGLIDRQHRKRGIRLTPELRPVTVADLVSIPVLASPVACGSPTTLLDEEKVGSVQISRKLVSAPTRTYAFRASGNSMDRAGIQDGDLVLVESTPDIADGDRVLASIDGYGTIKRLKKGADSLTLCPESTDSSHQPIFLHESDNAVIAGKVVRVLAGA